MGDRLRAWVESRCWPGGDGSWFVEVPFLPPGRPNRFVLPDGAAKAEYLGRAVALGRRSLFPYAAVLAFSLVAALHLVVSCIPAPAGTQFYMLPLILAVIAAQFTAFRPASRAADDMEAWLHLAGRSAPPDPPQAGDGGGWPRLSLRDDRPRHYIPAWMLAGAVVAWCATTFSVALAAVTNGGRSECREAAAAWLEGTSAPGAWWDRCFGLSAASNLLLVACMLALAGRAARIWCRPRQRPA